MPGAGSPRATRRSPPPSATSPATWFAHVPASTSTRCRPPTAVGISRGLDAIRACNDGAFGEWTGNVGRQPILTGEMADHRSPTGLEQYAICPFRFFLGQGPRRPRARTTRGPGDDRSPRHGQPRARGDGGVRHPPPGTGHAPGVGRRPKRVPSWRPSPTRSSTATAAPAAPGVPCCGTPTGPRSGVTSVGSSSTASPAEQCLCAPARGRARLRVRSGRGPCRRGRGRPRPPARFSGRTDRIDRTDDGKRVVVVDYKTAGSVDFPTSATTSVMRGTKLQLPIYGLAARAGTRGRGGERPTGSSAPAHRFEKQGPSSTTPPYDRFRDVLSTSWSAASKSACSRPGRARTRASGLPPTKLPLLRLRPRLPEGPGPSMGAREGPRRAGDVRRAEPRASCRGGRRADA